MPTLVKLQRRSSVCSLTLTLLLVVGALSESVGAVRAQQPRRAIELKDFYRIENVGSPAISPDGKMVAFVRTYLVEAENRRHSEIWLAPSDGASAPARLTDPSINSSNPRWSPDGKLLAFSAARRRGAAAGAEESSPIWFLRMDLPGSAPFQIQGLGGTPIFSPNNQWIAFTKRTPPAAKPPKQYASDFEKKIDERFKGRVFDWMEYRFDQRGYLPDPRDPSETPPEELYVLPKAGGTAKQITKLGVNVQSLSWRPDSGALVIEANSH